MSWSPTEIPWNGMHAGYAGSINVVAYLVLLDSQYKWPEAISTPPTISAATISALDRIFTTDDIPEILVLDNVTQFCLSPFEEYCRQKTTNHIRMLLYHPQ